MQTAEGGGKEGVPAGERKPLAAVIAGGVPYLVLIGRLKKSGPDITHGYADPILQHIGEKIMVVRNAIDTGQAHIV